jgi:hypothetical protein
LLILGLLLLFYSLAGCGDLDTEVATMTVSPAAVTVGVNKSQAFNVTAKNSGGFLVSATPVWSADSTIGTISSSGLFTAANSAVTGKVTATYGNISAAASVIITENGWVQGTISGDLGAGNNIKVYLDEVPIYSDRADSSGKYSIEDVPAGTYRVLTEATSLYQAGSQEVTVGRGETVDGVNFFLQLQPGIPTIPTTTIPTF